eukprot:jgi/Orpsp1_1/1179238/evm.model.c7180000068567.1
MKSLSLLVFLLLNTLLVLSNSIEGMINQEIDFDGICDSHYNSNVTDEELGMQLHHKMNLVANQAFIQDNILKHEEEESIKSEILEIVVQKLKEADEKYISGKNLDKRGYEASWYEAVCGPVTYLALKCFPLFGEDNTAFEVCYYAALGPAI